MKSVTALNKGWRYIVPMIEVSRPFFVFLFAFLRVGILSTGKLYVPVEFSVKCERFT